MACCLNLGAQGHQSHPYKNNTLLVSHSTQDSMSTMRHTAAHWPHGVTFHILTITTKEQALSWNLLMVRGNNPHESDFIFFCVCGFFFYTHNTGARQKVADTAMSWTYLQYHFAPLSFPVSLVVMDTSQRLHDAQKSHDHFIKKHNNSCVGQGCHHKPEVFHTSLIESTSATRHSVGTY